MIFRGGTCVDQTQVMSTRCVGGGRESGVGWMYKE